ncbi:acyltransferase [Paucibacter sp. PLA-PC-4]|uniref:acyltransferase n=1 Tax=Paucibacter sp. PLA-PC-4 TaxID=2993655 RepID=UPI00224AE061|nr:acyltransferase [Paucibacter sp. PLA-PC-4]MCX2865137.1 acyltransferase [Paucibacter sp. PLA-PC-4]
MKLKHYYRRLLSLLWWRRRFAQFGDRSLLFTPLLVTEPKRIFIGNQVCIRDQARLEIVRAPGADWQPKLEIGNRVNIEQGVHIVCQCSVVIEDDVSITPYCVIVDTYHPHDPPDGGPKIGSRLPNRPTHVRIGAGTFVGTHSVILPDVTIGRGCVIGAGSVVTTDIPDYCIATGSPARVVKKFDTVSRQWLTAPGFKG